MQSSSTSREKRRAFRTICLKLSAEVESAVGTILEASIKKLEDSIKHMSESCVSLSAGSDKESLGNDSEFVAAINVGNLHKAVTKAAADKQELINLRADLNDPKDGLDLLNEAEKLICKAKGQINRAGCHDSVGGPSDN